MDDKQTVCNKVDETRRMSSADATAERWAFSDVGSARSPPTVPVRRDCWHAVHRGSIE